MSGNKRFDAVLNECDELEYITDVVGCVDRDFAEFLDFANDLANENMILKKERTEIKEALDYLEGLDAVTLADIDGTLNVIKKIIDGDSDE